MHDIAKLKVRRKQRNEISDIQIRTGSRVPLYKLHELSMILKKFFPPFPPFYGYPYFAFSFSKTACRIDRITHNHFMFTETRRPAPVDLAFALSASSFQSRSSIKLMRDVIQVIIEDYGTRDIHYSFIIYGSEASTKYSFTSEPVDPDYLKNFAEFMPVINPPTSPHVALEEATKAFKGAGVRANATKVLVVMTDRKGDSTKEEIDAAADPLKQMKVKVIVVGIGANVDKNELVNVTGDNTNVITVPVDADKDSLTKTLMKKVFKPGNLCFCSYFLDTCFLLFKFFS